MAPSPEILEDKTKDIPVVAESSIEKRDEPTKKEVVKPTTSALGTLQEQVPVTSNTMTRLEQLGEQETDQSLEALKTRPDKVAAVLAEPQQPNPETPAATPPQGLLQNMQETIFGGAKQGFESAKNYVSGLFLPENRERLLQQSIAALTYLGLENTPIIGAWFKATIDNANRKLAVLDIQKVLKEEDKTQQFTFDGIITETMWEEYKLYKRDKPDTTIPLLLSKYMQETKESHPNEKVSFPFTYLLKKPEDRQQEAVAKKNNDYLQLAKSSLTNARAVTVVDDTNGKVTIDLDQHAVTIPSQNIGIDFLTINNLLLAHSPVSRKIEIENNGLIDQKKIRVYLDTTKNVVTHVRKDAKPEVFQAMINGKLDNLDVSGSDEKIFELKSGQDFIPWTKVPATKSAA